MFTISENTKQFASSVWFDLTDPGVVNRIKEYKADRIAAYAENYFRQDKLISLIAEKRKAAVCEVFPRVNVEKSIYLSLPYSDFTDNSYLMIVLSSINYQVMKETVQMFLNEVFPGKTIDVQFNQDVGKGLEITITW